MNGCFGLAYANFPFPDKQPSLMIKYNLEPLVYSVDRVE
jgi:hypothetical protein